MAYAKVLGAHGRQDGYLEGSGYLISWCVGHIANRSRTVKRGSVSASALYDIIGDKASATILEAYPQYAIAILNEAKDNCDEQLL